MRIVTDSFFGGSNSALVQRVKTFQPRLQVDFRDDGFIVKTANSEAEFVEVLKLRHEIFIREWQGREKESGLDLEPSDFAGDHLLIIRESDNMIVGTYRLLCSKFVERFYSEDEFEMSDFLRWPSVKLELGRACIHHEFRNGITIDLLWKGLAQYILASEARYLFGCSSVKTSDARLIEALYVELHGRDQWRRDFQIAPTPKYRLDGFEFKTERSANFEGKKLREMLPPLLRSYLHAGAAVFGEPAYDREFACVDLLTILDLQSLNRRFQERFFPQGRV